MPVYRDEDSKTWYVRFRYTDWTGKKRQTTKRGFKRQRDAQKYADDFVKQESGSANMSFQSMYKLYMEDIQPRIRIPTYMNKVTLFESKVLPYFKDLSVNEIDSATVRKWQNKLIKDKRKFSPTYLKLINNQLSAIFNFAVKHYNLRENPAAKAGSIGKMHADAMKFWTVEEFRKFISCTTSITYKTIFTLLFWTGMREGELLALTYKDFDFDKKTLSINKTYTRIGKKDFIGDTKTIGSNREIMISDFLLDMIKEYKTHIYDFNPKDRLFIVTKYGLGHEMRRSSEVAGVTRIRIHDLRHSHASYLIHKKIPDIAIAERLGHKNIETTLRTYAHLYQKDRRSIVEMIQEEHLGQGANDGEK